MNAYSADADDQTPERGSRARRVWLVVILAVIVFLLAVCWVGLRAITVKDGLTESQQYLREAQNGGDIEAALAGMSESAESAGSAASDPVWAVMEWIPAVGDNLKGVRLAAQSLDALVNDVALPMIDVPEGAAPIGTRLLTIAEQHGERVGKLATDLQEVRDSRFLIGQVRDGVEQVDEVMALAGPALSMAPNLLGADEAKNYLLVFQNNAETLALGGSAAAQSLVRVDKGQISLGAQGDSGNYQNGVAVDVPVPESALALYTSYLVDHINTSMSRPDFPSAAQIMRAWWQRDIQPDEISTVISVDPLAIERILVATGPIELPSGDVLSSDNAVSLLLSQVYGRWDSYKEPEKVDGFFADAASAIFGAIAAGTFDLKDMAWALGESAKTGSLLLWSEDEQVAELVKGTKASGVLPADNSDTTTVGVYFNNSNGSKIDYFTQTSTAVTAVCEAGNTTFTVNAGLSLPLTQQQAEALPRYVQSMTFGARFRDWIFVYGPPGTTLTDATVAGDEVTVMHRDIDDLGRPVVAFEAWFDPSDEVSIQATFVGEGSDFGPLELRTNPMINGAKPEITNGCATE